MQQALYTYTAIDCRILREGMMKLRRLFLQQTNVEPFSNAVTIAGLAQKDFLINYYTARTFAIIPLTGVSKKRGQSRSALVWMMWRAEMSGLRLQCAISEKGEYRIHTYWLDGVLWDDHNNPVTALEFMGCR